MQHLPLEIYFLLKFEMIILIYFVPYGRFDANIFLKEYLMQIYFARTFENTVFLELRVLVVLTRDVNGGFVCADPRRGI
jgi:hypothetical protein